MGRKIDNRSCISSQASIITQELARQAHLVQLAPVLYRACEVAGMTASQDA